MLDISIKNELLTLLHSLSGESTFVAQGGEEFVLPGLEIKELGTIPFPLTPLVAKHIIEQAQKAPYGKGNQTLIDTNVRNTWEIDTSQILLTGKHWNKTLAKIVHKLKEQLGISDRSVIPELYKLLLYEPGSFFLKHKDSEKNKGMFGSLVIIFPSTYTGGQFVIEFDGKKETIDLSQQSEELNWIAFFADCDHEILPVIEGYRLSLVFNLLCNDQEESLAPFQVSKATALALSFFKQKEFNTIEKPLGLILKHQYTPTNFSLEQLKGGDYETANILIAVAQKLGWYANAGLLNHHIIGVPLHSNYYDRDFDDEDAVIDEVIHDTTSIDNWCIKPSVGELSLKVLDIVNAVDFDSDEPFEKQAEGYMGNYGPEVEYWYHYAIIILAPNQAFNNLLLDITINEKIEWIAFYLGHHQDINKAINIYQSIDWSHQIKKTTNTDAIYLLWSTQPRLFMKDTMYEAKFIKTFALASNQNIANLFYQLNSKGIKNVLTTCIQTEYIEASEKCSDILAYMFSNEQFAFSAITHHLESPFIEYFKDMISKYEIGAVDYHKLSRQRIVRNLISISTIQTLELDKIEQEIASLLTRKLMYDVFLPVIYDVSNVSSLLERIKKLVIHSLEKNTVQIPQAPQDFYRDFPLLKKMDNIDHMLCDFCKTKEAPTMEYKKAEWERQIVISKITTYDLDIECSTIKKGSPHTLVLKKNENSYQRQLKEFHEDVKIITTLKSP